MMNDEKTTDTRPVVLFDGVCNLCNDVVQFVIAQDPQGKLAFASLQSAVGQQFLQHHRLPTADFDSFVLIDGDKVYTESTAALNLLKVLGGKWKPFGMLLVVPRLIRDAVYRLIARNRYRWFGRKEACLMPTPNLRSRFLD